MPRCNYIAQLPPFQFPSRLPFASLGDFVAHEVEFLAGTGHLVSQQQAQIGEFLPGISGHLGKQRTFAMHNFIMRERHHEVFGIGIKLAEGEFIVVIAAVYRVMMEITQVCRSSSPCST